MPVAKDINLYAAAARARVLQKVDWSLFENLYTGWSQSLAVLSVGAHQSGDAQRQQVRCTVCEIILRHRIVRSFQAQAAGVSTDQIIDRLIEKPD